MWTVRCGNDYNSCHETGMKALAEHWRRRFQDGSGRVPGRSLMVRHIEKRKKSRSDAGLPAVHNRLIRFQLMLGKTCKNGCFRMRCRCTMRTGMRF